MLAVGSKFGDYQILEHLGSGAMGDVYKAIDSRLDRVVALKLINDKLSKSSEYKTRLAQEAKAAAKIDSTHVVKVWEHSEVEGHPFISLEFVPGRTLREVCGELRFEDKLDLALQIALGLKAAHSQGLIHRDLKPENIKMAENGQAKILDFGLAKTALTDSVDRQGNIEGTLYYLSPEQLTGENITFGSDLFSLGVILYEILAGRRPFEGEYPAAIIYSILHEDPPPPSSINEEITGRIDELILRLLAKQEPDRFKSIDEVLSFMESCRIGAEPEKAPVKTRQTVTVIDLKNLSGDNNWEYFCIGFTEDLISELSRRTDLIVSAEPSTSYIRDVREVFKHCRSDFVIIGSLMKWQDKIKLHLKIYGNHGASLISGKNYEAIPAEIFDVLSRAVQDTSSLLEQATGYSAIEVDDYFKTDIAAYEYYLKGKNYYQTNNPDDLEIAERMFLKALEIDPSLAYAYSGLSDIYATRYNYYYDRSLERIEMAKSMAMKAIEISPNLPEAHRSLGRYYMFLGISSKAETAFLKAIEINPKFAIGYRTMAWLKELEGDHDKAIYWARMSLKYAPNDLETLLLLSLINMDLRKYTVAMATLQRAIELAPDYGRAHYNLGHVYYRLGVFDLALESFQLAIKYKGDPNAYLSIGYIYLAKKEYDKAMEAFEESKRVGYFPFIALYFEGFAERLQGREESAKKYFLEAIETVHQCDSKDKDNPHFKAYCAMTLAALGEKEKAQIHLAELENSGSLNGQILLEIARGYAILGNAETARELIKRALAEHDGPSDKEIAIDPHFKSIEIAL